MIEQKTLADYREILAGWEDDARDSERDYLDALTMLEKARTRYQSDLIYVTRLRSQVREMERLSEEPLCS